MDADALRDRIAEGPLLAHRISATTLQEHRCSCDRVWRDSRQYRHHVAQAVIDDLGLTAVEMTLGVEKEDGTPFTGARLVGQLEEVREPPPRTRRLKACVDEWPSCEEGEYHPLCCRFPKSCSCTVYDPERVSPEDLEDLP